MALILDKTLRVRLGPGRRVCRFMAQALCRNTGLHHSAFCVVNARVEDLCFETLGECDG